MVVVADTSPITALLHLQQIHLLKRLYGQVFVPLSVAAELKTLFQFGYDVSFLEMKDVFIIRCARRYILQILRVGEQFRVRD